MNNQIKTTNLEPNTKNHREISVRVKGMHCASCASIIEKALKKCEGVSVAEVNYGTEKVKISFDEAKTNPEKLSKNIKPLGYNLEIFDADTSTKLSAGKMGMS